MYYGTALLTQKTLVGTQFVFNKLKFEFVSIWDLVTGAENVREKHITLEELQWVNTDHDRR